MSYCFTVPFKKGWFGRLLFILAVFMFVRLARSRRKEVRKEITKDNSAFLLMDDS